MDYFADHKAGEVSRIVAPGRNCWRTERANRLAFLIDSAAYFRAFKAAALRARHSILIIGWDVNSRTPLEFPEHACADVPNELGPLLNHLTQKNKNLQINVLCWDSPLIYAPDREAFQQVRFGWFAHPGLCFALDDQHPLGASHHQKIVVIDDRIGFVGGIDLTVGRLDEPEHRPHDPRRRNLDGTTYTPHHDVQVAVSGDAARALGTLARDRWARATGQTLPASKAVEDCWPEHLSADLTDVDVAIARTYPMWKGLSETREVEQLYLDTLAEAKEAVYVENQYFTAESVVQKLIERLAEPECPEIVMVLPQEPTGWLEQTAMGVAQRCSLARVRAADRHGRFRVYMPVVGEAGEAVIKVHSKVVVADGRFLRIGSSNLNNRSMGLDSECDLALEADNGTPTSNGIAYFRDRLLAEHLDVSPERVQEAIQLHGSLIAAVEKLRGSGRSLKPFPDVSPDEIEIAVAKSKLLDPGGTMEAERIADEFASDGEEQTSLHKSMIRLAVVVIALLGFAALWRWGPLAQFADAATLEAWAQALDSPWRISILMLAAYVVGGLFMFPVLILIAAVGLILGPFMGLLVATTGSLLSAFVGYGVGALLGRKLLGMMSGGRLHRLSRQLAKRGIMSITVIRLLPLAPFTLVNMAAGASHVRFRDFALGTVLGMSPGIVTITLFSGQVGEVMRAPDPFNIGVLIALLLIIGSVGIWSWRRFVLRRDDSGGVSIRSKGHD